MPPALRDVDPALVALAADGDGRADIVRALEKPIYNVARRMLLDRHDAGRDAGGADPHRDATGTVPRRVRVLDVGVPHRGAAHYAALPWNEPIRFGVASPWPFSHSGGRTWTGAGPKDSSRGAPPRTIRRPRSSPG